MADDEQATLATVFEDVLLAHSYRGSYRLWCKCGRVEPMEHHDRVRGVNVAALHRTHVANVLNEAVLSRLAAAWIKGHNHPSATYEHGDNPYLPTEEARTDD